MGKHTKELDREKIIMLAACFSNKKNISEKKNYNLLVNQSRDHLD